MKKERKVWAITLIAFWWLAPNQTNAQQDSIKSSTLNEVVVTATKFPKNVSETGKVLTVIDEEQIARSIGKDVSQLLNEQVGLVVNGANSNPGKDKSVYLQGAGNGYTLILIDGVPANDPSGFGGAYDLRLLPVDQVERIEILKGSQSTLYGTDAIAGVINIITKKKSDKPLNGNATLSYGSYNSFKGMAGISGGTKLLDYNIGYTRYNTDGISEAKDPTGNGNYDKDGYSQDAFQANLGFKVSNALTLRPYFRYNNFNGKYDDGAFTESPVISNSYTSYLTNTGLNGQYTFTRGAVNLLYGYDKTERNYQSAFPVSYSGRFQHVESFVNYNLVEHFQFLAGISYQSILMLDQSTTPPNPNVTITSPYVSLFLKNLNGLSIELGGRLNNHSKYGDNFTYSFNPSYLVNNRLKLFANVSSGFKTPTLSQLYGAFGRNDELKPEKSQSVEAGVQLFSTDKKTDIRLSSFKRDLTDVIFFQSYPGFVYKYINLNNQNDNGAEVEISRRIDSKLTLQAFYAYVDGQITDKSGTKDSTYHNLYRRPKHSFGLKVGYQVTPKFFAQVNLKTFSNRSDLYYNSAIFANQVVNLDAYALLDLYIEYRIYGDRIKVFIDMKNLLNQDYMEVYGYNTLKFNAMSGLNFRF